MIQPIKSLGQNFLRDDNVLRNIVYSLDLKENEVVLEIGPGQGALTKHLCEKPIKLIGVEIDERAVHLLQDRFADKIELIHNSILDMNLNRISEQYKSKIKVVGNIPYYLTSEILFFLFDYHAIISSAALMVQYEVANRLIAKTHSKDYGILTVFTKFYCDCKLLFKVSRNSFYPKPDVDSALVKMEFKEHLPEIDIELFRSVVRATFGKRRKTVRNGLKALGIKDAILNSLSFNLKKRPEELNVEEFLLLTNKLAKILNT